MKQIVLFILILSSVKIDAQFKSIANGQNINWIVKNEIWDRAIIDTLHLTDTININSIIYHKVIYNSELFNKNNNLVGYFREDTILGKAWFWGYMDTTEYLIMDLSLKKGDSIYTKMIYGNKYAHIINVDFVRERKILTTDYHYGGGFISEDLKFIEGVGPNASIMCQIDESTATEIGQKFGYLICKKYSNSELVYAWDTVKYDCGLLWDKIEEITKDQMLIFPNPVVKILNLKLSNYGKQSVTIYNPFGIIIEQFEAKSNTININVSNYPKGFYFIRIGSKVNKFIKQ